MAGAAAGGHVLHVTGLVRSFDGQTVLSGVELAARCGDRVVLVGPNGSGKTTLLRCVLGTLAPDSGSVEIAGHPAGSLHARRLVAASLAQERSFYLRLTGHENLLLAAGLRGLRRASGRRRVAEIVSELGLEHVAAMRANRCSTGQLQLLGLARALLADAPLLLLDEPTRSLDAAARRQLWGALDRRPHTAAVIASHLAEDVALATIVVELSGGGTR